MVDIISRKLPCICNPLVIAALYVFCYLWVSNIVVVDDMINLNSLWYSSMCRNLYDIWFLGS